MKALLPLFLLMTPALPAALQVVALPSQSPLVSLRLVFRTGAAYDPPGKPGVAAMTAAMLTEGGTKSLAYPQIVDRLFPMAASVDGQVDKEMVTIRAKVHRDNLDAFYALFRSMLLEPGWRPDDFARLKDDAVNQLRVALRGNNDEELGKEVLYTLIYAGHPYGQHNLGTVSSLQAMTLDDVKAFYQAQFTQANLILGVGGGYPDAFLAQLKADLAKLPAGTEGRKPLPAPKPVSETRVTLVDKSTRSVAVSLGYPIDVRRGHPDYPALLLAQSYFGQHRMSGGRLFDRMRQVRGLNYGDYAYIEYFPRGMFQLEPDPNLARQQQIFQVWIRPLEPPTARFGLRLALHELQRLVTDGLTQADFERTRAFAGKYVNLLMKTKDAELGYAIDSLVYGIPRYDQYLARAFASLTRDDVNRAIRRHLRSDRLQIVAVTNDAENLRTALLADEPSPMTYNSGKPDDILAEDRLVEGRKLALKPEQVTTLPVAKVFE